MAAKFRHFALNADDVPRAKAFYEAVFGWKLEPWGPPEYYQALTACDGAIVALQHRRELKPGVRMAGFEASLAVDDLDATIAALERAGGRVVTRPVYIEGVGRLVYFEDTEGNLVGAMQYDADELTRIEQGPALSYGDGYLVRSAATTYPDGLRLDRHDHPWGQLAFCSAGVMRVVSDAAAWLAPPTRAIWLPAGVAHEIVMRGEVATRFLYICPELAEPLPTQLDVIEVAPLLRELIQHILKIRMLHPDRPEQDRLARLLIDLLLQARRLDLGLPLPRDRRAQALAEQLQETPGTSASLAELARHAGASLRTLQRLFPAETGLTLEAWRQKARLIWSITQLSAGVSVSVTAAGAGYESPSAFIAAFRRQFGVTPGRYRTA